MIFRFVLIAGVMLIATPVFAVPQGDNFDQVCANPDSEIVLNKQAIAYADTAKNLVWGNALPCACVLFGVFSGLKIVRAVFSPFE